MGLDWPHGTLLRESSCRNRRSPQHKWYIKIEKILLSETRSKSRPKWYSVRIIARKKLPTAQMLHCKRLATLLNPYKNYLPTSQTRPDQTKRCCADLMLKDFITHNMSRLTTKPTKWPVRPVKTQISLDICPVWSESSLSAWRNLESFATHGAHCKDWLDWANAQADLSLCWVHRMIILLVLSWGSSHNKDDIHIKEPFLLEDY